MYSYYKRKLKNKTIQYADSYVPYGLTLGDFSVHLKILDDSDNEDMNEDYEGEDDEIANVEITDNRDEVSAESENDHKVLLYNRIANQLFNQRRNNFQAQNSDDASNSCSDNIGPEKDIDANVNDDDYDEDTTIEFNIPSVVKSESTDIVDVEKFTAGLTLLNMSFNNDIILKNPNNLKNFTGQSIAKIINSIKDGDTLNNIFSNLDDEIKVNVLKLYLTNEQVVEQLKVEKHYTPQKNNIPAKSEISLNHLIFTLFQAFFTFGIVIYNKFGIPVLNLIWCYVQDINDKYNVLDIFIQNLVKLMTSIVKLCLRLTLLLTDIMNDNQPPQLKNNRRHIIRKKRVHVSS